ncbi:hypothetical protein IM774_08490 [Erysipelotrichaceae bacterium RD49]|nr:hypothetical protein [Erysipelotrichaceae bacterium RD49]
MQISQEQIQELEDLLDDAWGAIGPSMAKNNPAFLLKAINSEQKASGYDDFYDLNERGQRLQDLYEAIYRQNEELMGR